MDEVLMPSPADILEALDDLPPDCVPDCVPDWRWAKMLAGLPDEQTAEVRAALTARLEQWMTPRLREQQKEQEGKDKDPEIDRHCEPVPYQRGQVPTRLVCFRPKDAPPKPPGIRTPTSRTKLPAPPTVADLGPLDALLAGVEPLKPVWGMRHLDSEARRAAHRRDPRELTLAELATRHPTRYDERDKQIDQHGNSHPKRLVKPKGQGWKQVWRAQTGTDAQYGGYSDPKRLIWSLLLGSKNLHWRRVIGKSNGSRTGRIQDDCPAVDQGWRFYDPDPPRYRNAGASLHAQMEAVTTDGEGYTHDVAARPIWDASPGTIGEDLVGQGLYRDPMDAVANHLSIQPVVLQIFAWANQQKLVQGRRYRALADALDLASYAGLDFAERMLDLVVLAYPDFLTWQRDVEAGIAKRAANRKKGVAA